MSLQLPISKFLKWVFLMFLILFIPFSGATCSSELGLICGPSDQGLNSSVSMPFVQNFLQVMESIQKQVALNEWAYDSVISPLPEVYALAQCHDDLSAIDCKICFSQGRIRLPRCLPAVSGRMFLDGCFIRYDNYNFFKETIDPEHDYVNCSQPTGTLADTLEFNNKVAKVIDDITETTVKNGTFAIMEAKRGGTPVYAMARCLNTLDDAGCKECLEAAGSKLKECSPGAEGRAMFAGCFMRYSTEKFFVNPTTHHYSKAAIITAITLAAVVFIALTSFGALIGYARVSKKKDDENNLSPFPGRSNLNFKYEVLEKATEFFSDSRKLGQGGAGSVFKGTLPDGRTVAVKRLVYNTRQWVDQFFNEVNLISGIHHNNLVRLLGCSIEGPESLLVYEYVPNRSLDQIIFVKNTMHILSWKQRFNIILGTAEGLAYLHGGSGVKIIHRDIKTSNILLDEMLTPKIADFGLAYCADTSHISTGIAGTLGYMAPEYLIRGQLTDKADVYGFGVLVLEIACGKKNSVFSQGSSSILHSVWKHYKANKITKSVDPGLVDNFPEKQAANVLQIGLLCTQASPSLRPSMAAVVEMLRTEDYEIPSPKQPPFLNASVLSPEDTTSSSITRVSITKTTLKDQVPSIDAQNSYATASTLPYHSTATELSEPR